MEGGVKLAGSIEGKVALVTGGGSRIGHATALTFAREGAKVVIADIPVNSGPEIVRTIEESGGDAIFVKADMSKSSEVSSMVAQAVETYGRLDCAFNNAGVNTARRIPTHECADDEWDRIIDINLKGVWLCMKHEIVQMLKQGGGAIVNTSSILG